VILSFTGLFTMIWERGERSEENKKQASFR